MHEDEDSTDIKVLKSKLELLLINEGFNYFFPTVDKIINDDPNWVKNLVGKQTTAEEINQPNVNVGTNSNQSFSESNPVSIKLIIQLLAHHYKDNLPNLDNINEDYILFYHRYRLQGLEHEQVVAQLRNISPEEAKFRLVPTLDNWLQANSNLNSWYHDPVIGPLIFLYAQIQIITYQTINQNHSSGVKENIILNKSTSENVSHNIQKYLFKAVDDFYDELTNVTLKQEHIEANKDLQAALLAAKNYNRAPDTYGEKTYIDENGVASSPVELDKLSDALEKYHRHYLPKDNLRNQWIGDGHYQRYIYPLYNLIMAAKRKLVCTALRAQDNAVGRCLADLIERPQLRKSSKGNTLLAEVLVCLKSIEEEQDKYLKNPLGTDENIIELKNTGPHQAELTRIAQDLMREWLEDHVNSRPESLYEENRGFMYALMEHRHYSNTKGSIFSTDKETVSMKYLQVALAEDLIANHENIYGKEFLEFFKKLAPTSDKAFAVAKALLSIPANDKEGFCTLLQSDNALTKALKKQGLGMSMFRESDTWQTMREKVLREISPSVHESGQVPSISGN